MAWKWKRSFETPKTCEMEFSFCKSELNDGKGWQMSGSAGRSSPASPQARAEGGEGCTVSPETVWPEGFHFVQEFQHLISSLPSDVSPVLASSRDCPQAFQWGQNVSSLEKAETSFSPIKTTNHLVENSLKTTHRCSLVEDLLHWLIGMLIQREKTLVACRTWWHRKETNSLIIKTLVWTPYYAVLLLR